MLKQPKPIPLNNVLITEELSRRISHGDAARSPRQPNLQAENQAMRSLAQQLAQAPEQMLQHLVDLAVALCGAGSAGVSLVEPQANGEAVFRWVAMAGLLAPSVGGCTPRNFSPCAVCLEQGAAVLFSYPERYFTYLQAANRPLVEGLVLPLIVDGQALGTIWVIAHDEQRQFDAEDVRLMTGLADFTITLLRSQQQVKDLLVVNTALKEEVAERKKTEAALRESQTRFRQVFDNNMVAMGTWTPTGDITEANDALLNLIGYTRTDLEAGAILWSKLTPPEYHDRDLQAVAEVRAKGVCTPYEKAFIHKDGHRQPILIGSGRFDEETGIGIFCAFDISDLKQTEAALRESEAKYRTLFESIDEGFCLIEVLFDDTGKAFDYRFLEPNPAFEKQTGLVNVVGKTAREVAPQHEAYWFEIYGRIVQTGVPERFENFAEVAGRFYDVYAFRTGEPEECKVAILFKDISDRKRAEIALQESEELKRRILESSQDCIKVLTLEGRLLYVNTGGFDLLEIDNPASILNTKWLDFWQDEDCLKAEAALAAARAGHAGQFQGCCPTTKGNLKWWDVIVTPIRDASGKVAQLLSISRDITKQKQAESEREQLLKREQVAREEAERANRIKDEFLAVLSHELRSPLTPILGWSKLLQSKSFDPATIQRALSTIERNAEIQTKLIDDLLDVARILRGKLKLDEITVNLATVIEAALEVVKTAAQAKSITLQFNLVEACFVRGDEGRLQQIVWNLLSNAIKFTPKGGQVGVRLETHNGQARIWVTDTGQGISPDFMPYLFQSFRQEDASITRQHGGLGLGLAIVKHLVDAHGGSITAASPGLGQGATFTVQLPLETASAPPVADPSPNIDLTGLKVLAVDDSEDTRALLSSLLVAYGAQTRIVTSGAEVLTNLRADF